MGSPNRSAASARLLNLVTKHPIAILLLVLVVCVVLVQRQFAANDEAY
jgi:hypothetical protein